MHIHIIGAGVIGLTTAYYLCEKGHKVTIIEQESNVALGASFANGGQLSYCFSDPLGKPGLLPKLPGIALNSTYIHTILSFANAIGASCSLWRCK